MTQFDTQILISLWKWKLLTTAAITEVHFSKQSPSYAHRRLLRLKKEGVIAWVYLNGIENGKSFAWELTKKGFAVILPLLPELRETGSNSESYEHDLLASAIHLGEWIYGLPNGCDIFTEQELKKYHCDIYPDWVPKTTTRRPDGYWERPLDGEPVVIALEVELHQKNLTEYRAIAQFYSRLPNLFRVVWLVRSKGIANAIYSGLKDSGVDERLYSFLLEKDFKKHGWDTPFFMGRDAGKSLFRLLSPPSETPPSGTLELHVASTLILNTLKSPHRSSHYLSVRKKTFSDRLGSSLVSLIPTSTSLNPTNKGVPPYEK